MNLTLKDLQDVDSVFKAANVRYWLAFGTVLGFYRDGDVIDGDDDVDYSCDMNEMWGNRKRLKKRLRLIGFVPKMLEDKKKLKIIAKRGDVTIAMAGFWKDGKHRYRNKWRIPDAFFKGGTINYKGCDFPCHSPIEKYLEWVYYDWKTPMPKHLGLRLYTQNVLRKRRPR